METKLISLIEYQELKGQLYRKGIPEDVCKDSDFYKKLVKPISDITTKAKIFFEINFEALNPKSILKQKLYSNTILIYIGKLTMTQFSVIKNFILNKYYPAEIDIVIINDNLYLKIWWN